MCHTVKSLLAASIAVVLCACALVPVDAGRHHSTDCIGASGQCGGKDYSGSTCCEAGSTCTYVNPYYSKCAESAPSAAPPMPNLSEQEFKSEQQQRAAFSDFTYKFDMPVLVTPYGTASVDVLATDPVLATLPGDGISQVYVQLAPSAVGQAHVHPRGTEVTFVTKGELFMGFVEEDGGRLVTALVKQNENMKFPQGLLHFALNPSCEAVEGVATFSTADPGFLFLPRFFELPVAVLRATLPGVDDTVLEQLVKAARKSINPALDPVCAKKCGL